MFTRSYSDDFDPRIALETPTLDEVAKTFQEVDMSDYFVIMILHFLGDLPGFIKQLESMGLRKERALLVSIPYSHKPYVDDYLKANGWRTLVSEGYDREEFKEKVHHCLSRLLKITRDIGGKLLIIEDGGYCVPMLFKHFSGDLDLVVGAVEQTANGVWLDKKEVKEFEKSGNSVPFPIVLVGESRLKEEGEPAAVSDAINRNVVNILMKMHRDIRHKKVAVLGFGRVGKKVAHSSRAGGAKVGVFDTSPTRMVGASSLGYNIPKIISASEFEWDLASFVNDHWLIMGTTGCPSINADLISRLDSDIYLASCSSKRIEIDMSYLEKNALWQEKIEGVGTRFILHGAANHPISVIVLGDGIPINFHGDSESIPAEHIELVWGLMLAEIIQILNGECRSGLQLPDERIEDLVAMLYLQNNVSC